jgi:hypothetical protein
MLSIYLSLHWLSLVRVFCPQYLTLESSKKPTEVNCGPCFFAFNGESVNQVGFWSSAFFRLLQSVLAPQSGFAPSSQGAFRPHSSVNGKHSPLEAEHSASALAELLLT